MKHLPRTRTIVLALIAIAVLPLCSYAQKGAVGRADPSQAVRDAFEKFANGIRQADADAVMSSYEKSDRLLIFNNNGTATIGWDNVRSNTEATYAKVKNVTLEITGLRVEMLGSTAAYLTCKWKQTQDNDGKNESSAGRMTLVYRLIGKEWKIVHRHTSPDKPDASRPVFP